MVTPSCHFSFAKVWTSLFNTLPRQCTHILHLHCFPRPHQCEWCVIVLHLPRREMGGISICERTADMFRSPHEDTAYLSNFKHSPTLLSISETTQLDASFSHCSTPIRPLSNWNIPRLGVWSVLASLAQCSSSYSEIDTKQPACLAARIRIHPQYVLSYFDTYLSNVSTVHR